MRDGKTIAAIAWKTINNIFVFPMGDATHGKQFTFGDRDIGGAVVLPNGRLLIHESGNPNGELWTMNTDGSQRAPFSSLRGTSFVSRCGSFVVFLAQQNENTLLIRTDTEGLNQKTLATGGLVSPSCSSSGDYIYYADWIVRPQRLFRISIDGGDAKEIAVVSGRGLIGTVAISPDGKFLAYPCQDESVVSRSTLVVIPSERGAPVKTFPDVLGLVRWSPGGRGLVHYKLQDGIAQLVKQSVAGGKPQQLTKFPSGRSEDFNWSPDGKWLYVAHGEVRSDVMLISNFR
jgi:Tol biopolymer transport system component